MLLQCNNETRVCLSPPLCVARGAEGDSRPPGCYTLAPAPRERFVTANPDRTARNKRDTRVFTQMSAYVAISIPGFERLTGRRRQNFRNSNSASAIANVYVNPAPLGQPTRPYLWKATTTLNVAPLRVGSSNPLPSLCLARAHRWRARSLPPSSFIYLAGVRSSSKEPPAGTSTAWDIAHQMARTLAQRATVRSSQVRSGIDDKIVFTFQSDVIEWNLGLFIKFYIYIYMYESLIYFLWSFSYFKIHVYMRYNVNNIV